MPNGRVSSDPLGADLRSPSALLRVHQLTRVQTIHEKNLIYRDIKPDNFLIGRPGTKGANTVYVVDFGMAKQYRDPKTKRESTRPLSEHAEVG